MMNFKIKDLFFCVITGLITGLIAWQIFEYLNKPVLFGFPIFGLILLVPILWVAGVWLGYFLGRWLRFFNQFGKFAAIGFTNGAVDYGILYILIAWSGVAGGYMYAVFKAVSFFVATIHSYVWNKFWVFSAGDSGAGGSEFLKFVSVSAVSIAVNVVTATVFVNFIGPMLGMDARVIAGLGAIAGSAVALIFNFVGFKITVFKQ
jgi:putative flippase GtrA